MKIQDISSRINELTMDEIEKYLEVLVDQLNYAKPSNSKLSEAKRQELDALYEGKLDLYEAIFARCSELKKLVGEPPPKFMGKITLEQFHREHRREIETIEELGKLLDRQYGK